MSAEFEIVCSFTCKSQLGKGFSFHPHTPTLASVCAQDIWGGKGLCGHQQEVGTELLWGVET